MKLPEPLSHWSEILNAFSEDVATLLLGFTDQLTQLIPVKPLNDIEGNIEPDGLDGLTKRVNYERLLISEWVLHDSHPDEFLRRAVSSEHLFLELQKRESKEQRNSYALFDCGPEQLGRPRLVQLAVLILLARRADKNGAYFKWGVLQDDSYQWHEGLSRSSIQSWLSLRSSQLVEQENLDSWLQALDTEGKVQDLWLISNSTCIQASKIGQTITIEEPVLTPNQIEVSVQANSGAKTLSLNLLNEALLVRIIRNPFEGRSKAHISGNWNAGDAWVMAANGRIKACIDIKGQVTLHRISTNIKNNVKNNKENKALTQLNIPIDKKCIGLHLSKKRSIALTVDNDNYTLFNYPQMGQEKIIQKKQSIPVNKTGNAPLSMVIIKTGSGLDMMLLLDAKQQLRSLKLQENNALIKTIDKDVITLGQLINCAYYLKHNKEEQKFTLHWYLGSQPNTQRSYNATNSKNPPNVFFHGSGSWHKGSVGSFAFENNNGSWTLSSPKDTSEINIDSDDRALGVITTSEKKLGLLGSTSEIWPFLIIVKNDKKSIYAAWKHGESLLCKLSSDLIYGELNLRDFYLHYVNTAKEMVVIDMISGDELYRLAQGVDS